MNLNRGSNCNSILNDSSLMPGNGIHAGKPMAQVPADYLHFLWHRTPLRKNFPNVADYIQRNLSALRKENSDLIWS